MSTLKPGTLCVIVAGCPKNIGLIVEVISHLGVCPPREDAYRIKTVSGRPFPQLKFGSAEHLARGDAADAITDRYKLRPLIGLNDKAKPREAEITPPPASARSTVPVMAELPVPTATVTVEMQGVQP